MNKEDNRKRRRIHIRKTLSGSSIKPRIFVFKSNRFFYAGFADDEKGVVIKSMYCKRKSEDIKVMAVKFSKLLSKYDSCVFDRSGYKYHGLIAIFADELRSKGVKI
jgi:large subunit ribosomal protein L18